jgi:hypothetical protein
LSSLPRGSTGDGVEPHSVECTKRGVEILGRIWFLPKGCYDLHLCLGRPHFSNLSSVTADAVRNLAVTEAWLDQQTLRVTAGIPRKGKGMVDKGMETTALPSHSRVPNSFTQRSTALPACLAGGAASCSGHAPNCRRPETTPA